MVVAPALLWMAGAAAVPITPPVGRAHPPVWLAGYGLGRRAEGVHDELYARALVLTEGRRGVAVVSLDLIGLFYEDTLAVRRLVGRSAPGAGLHVVVHCTHTHAGPDTLGMWGPARTRSGRDPGYMERVRRAAARAVLEAYRARREARVRIGQAHVAGLIRDIRLPTVIDDRVFALSAETPQGRPIATVIGWNNHPEVKTRRNVLVSADFPSAVVRRVEAVRGGVGIYLTGAIGGQMTPLEAPVPDPGTGRILPEGSWEKMKAVGYTVADAGLAALARAPQAAGLSVRTTTVYVPLTNRGFRILAGLGVIQRPVYTEGRPDPLLGVARVWWKHLPTVEGRDVLTEVGILQIGLARIALVPGELYPELSVGGIPAPADPGADFRDAPRETPPLEMVIGGTPFFVLGLANDELGYIIPKSEWDEKRPYMFGQRRAPYGEVNSAGPDLAPRLTAALRFLAQ